MYLRLIDSDIITIMWSKQCNVIGFGVDIYVYVCVCVYKKSL